MYLSILVPSTIAEHFARYVDGSLCANEDWRLVFYEKNATALDFDSPQTSAQAKRTIRLICHSSACADPEKIPEIMRQQGCDIYRLDVVYDLWSFDLNPLRLLDSVEEVLSLLGGLGCYWALHSFPVDPRFLTKAEIRV